MQVNIKIRVWHREKKEWDVRYLLENVQLDQLRLDTSINSDASDLEIFVDEQKD